MLTCVAAAQLLIYRLADGSYGTIKYSTDDFVDPRDTPTGRLVSQYRAEFYSARISFFLGLFTLLTTVACKALAIFDESIALPVVGLIGATGSVMLTFFAASYVQVFQPLEGPSQPSARQESPSRDVVPWLLPALAGACAAVVLGAVVGGSMEGMGSETATPSKEQGLGASIRSRMPNGGGDGAKPAKDPTAQAQAKPSSATGSAAVAS